MSSSSQYIEREPEPEPEQREPEPEPEPEPEYIEREVAPAPEPEPAAAAPPPPPPEPVAPTPEPVAPTPEPVASTPAPDPGATMMPEALKRQSETVTPEPKAPKERKPPRERKPRTPKAAPTPKPAKPPKEPKAPREPGAPSKAFPIVLVVGALVAVILGFVLGSSGGGGDADNASAGALTGTAESGDVSVKVPEGFAGVDAAPDVPGLSIDKVAAYGPKGEAGGTVVMVGNVEGDSDNPTLLAFPFLQAIGERPAPSGAVEIGDDGLQAYRYDALKPNGFDRTVTVYAAPTSAGVATVACLAPAADAESFAKTCDQVANTLQVGDSAEPLPVGPSKDYAETVSKVLAGLDKGDKAGRADLASAKTPTAQAAAARSLSAAFAKAAKSLAAADVPLADRSVHTPLVKGLRQTSAAYGKLAAAAVKNDKGAYRKAGGDVSDGRKAVADALAGLKNAGYDVAS